MKLDIEKSVKNLTKNSFVLFGKKFIEVSIKNGLIVTKAITGKLLALKATNVKLPKTFLDAMDIMKLASGIRATSLLKDYAVYKKWIYK